MVTNASIFAWKIPWTEEPGQYSQWGLKESDLTEWLCTLACICIYISIQGFFPLNSIPVNILHQLSFHDNFMSRFYTIFCK